jgi:hypothetical protein
MAEAMIRWGLEYIKRTYGPSCTLSYLPEDPYPSTLPGAIPGTGHEATKESDG